VVRASGAVVAVLWTVWFGSAVGLARAERLTLVENGRATASIVLAARPARAAQFAAAELQYHLSKMTGATVPVITDAVPLRSPAILVGESAATRALGLTSRSFGPQEYLIGFRPGALVLMGRDSPDLGVVDYQSPDTFPGDFAEQGTVYGVYDFLERFGDVRWYLPTELGEVIPARPTFAVEGQDIRRRPAMIYRYVYRGEALPADLIGDTVNHEGPCPELDLRSARLYMRRMRQGGSAYNANHSFEGYYSRFLGKHREWFAQGYGDQPPQLCFTNPGLINQAVNEARDYFDTGTVQPRSVAAGDFFALVPMDNVDWCRCERCQALILTKPTLGSAYTSNNTASDYIFGFINQVAREVGKTHPDKWLAALAYGRYVYPPTREPLERNVSIMLCLPTRLTYSRERRDNDRRVLQAWTQESVARPKFVWLYYCFPSLWASEQDWRPYPGFFAHSIVRQFAQFHRSGVRGFFIEPSYLTRGQRSPLMDQLELYLTYRLADDPTVDGNREIAEFFERYYGPSAAPMRALYESMEATYADPANHPGRDVAQTEAQAWLHLGTEERMREYGRLLSKARSLARQGTSAQQQRVALFDRGIYRWMQEGRKGFLEIRALAGSPPPGADIPRIANAQGDPERADWTAAATLGGWRSLRGGPTTRQVRARMAHDGEYLYVELEETGIDPTKLVLGDEITVWNEDEWEVFVAPARGPRYRQMGLNAAGVHFDLAYDEPSPQWDSGVALRSSLSAPDRWTVRMALPLRQLVPGGAKPGDTLYFNALRATRMLRSLAWSPTYGGFREPMRLGEIRLAK
jgi:hypothetical protein